MAGIIFHYFHDTKKYNKCQGSLSAQEFEKLVLYFRGRYTLLNIDEYIQKAVKGSLCESDICLTFDDGIRSQYEVAVPVLEKYNIRAGFFVYTEPFCNKLSQLEIDHDFRFKVYHEIDEFYSDFFCQLKTMPDIYTDDVREKIANFKYEDYKPECAWHTFNDKLFRYTRSLLLKQVDYRQIMALLMKKHHYDVQERIEYLWMKKEEISHLHNCGHMIGLHSHTHPTDISSMNLEMQKKEYAQNAEWISRITNHQPEIAAYPCGNYDDASVTIMKELGITAAFVAKRSEANHIYELSRINHTEMVREMLNCKDEQNMGKS